MRSRRILLILFALVVAAAAAGAMHAIHRYQVSMLAQQLLLESNIALTREEGTGVGQAAPELSGKSLSGDKAIALTDYRGKVVCIAFWFYG